MDLKRGDPLGQKKWFIMLQDQVSGPYSDSDVENYIQSNQETMVWGRGQSEWMSPEKWRGALKELEAQARQEKQQNSWRVRVGIKELSPMSFDELIENLKEYSDYSHISVWVESMGGWCDVYQVRKIMDELGVSRRKFPRVPIMGQLKGSFESGQMLSARVISVSEGGIGVSDIKNLQLGERLQGVVSSPNLFMNVTCSLEVVYIGGEGYAGLRFIHISGEAKSAVIEYVKKFQQSAAAA